MKKKIYIIIAVSVILVVLLSVFSVNYCVKSISSKKIISPEKITEINNADCIIILGCGVKFNGQPSMMLADRLERGIDLYKQGVAPKIIMSGDHGQIEYDEVNTMKQFAIDKNIPSEDIFMDHAGFSTYESMYRAKEIFKAQSIVIVSQEYHLYRAIYLAEKLGIEAYGVNADYRLYGGEKYREAREILARFKDFFKTVFKPEPTYLGETIPVSGNGNITND